MRKLDDKLQALENQIGLPLRWPTWNEWHVAHDELPIQEWLVAYINVQTLAAMETAEEVESHDDFIKQRLEETAAKLESLTKERDEARREVCEFGSLNSKQTHQYATYRGWDCFKEDRA